MIINSSNLNLNKYHFKLYYKKNNKWWTLKPNKDKINANKHKINTNKHKINTNNSNHIWTIKMTPKSPIIKQQK